MTALVPDVPEFMRAAGALLAGDWFDVRQDTGPYAVWSVGEAGIPTLAFSGFHYPYQALAKADDMNAATTLIETFYATNEDDPEESVEKADEAYWCERYPLELEAV